MKINSNGHWQKLFSPETTLGKALHRSKDSYISVVTSIKQLFTSLINLFRKDISERDIKPHDAGTSSLSSGSQTSVYDDDTDDWGDAPETPGRVIPSESFGFQYPPTDLAGEPDGLPPEVESVTPQAAELVIPQAKAQPKPKVKTEPAFETPWMDRAPEFTSLDKVKARASEIEYQPMEYVHDEVMEEIYGAPQNVTFNDCGTVPLEEAYGIVTAETMAAMNPLSVHIQRAKSGNPPVEILVGGKPVSLGWEQFVTSGGSKTVVILNTEKEGSYALAIPSANTTVNEWNMALDEVGHCHQFRKKGLLTHPMTRLVDVTFDGKKIPAILMRPFQSLDGQVLDIKKNDLPDDTLLKGASLELTPAAANSEEELKDIVGGVIRDAAVFSTFGRTFTRETCNFCMKDGELRLFPFDTQGGYEEEDEQAVLDKMSNYVSGQLLCLLTRGQPDEKISPFMKYLKQNPESFDKMFHNWVIEETNR
ncbi:hypothetical protein [Parendozoicomonas haliclonae]|uniref:Uncharacterized protein n=1 Tax=Parendozoicomonas haliclonae TaxID=1960125 RepID=A0A1X7ADU8_9GAMM|nr:hypothetical protein [Parendozoicomonas haliclonae]SMA32665.1 hypothetical protein EHSB41UT_00177 [Parendozoicomonas haliclonae]